MFPIWKWFLDFIIEMQIKKMVIGIEIFICKEFILLKKIFSVKFTSVSDMKLLICLFV